MAGSIYEQIPQQSNPLALLMQIKQNPASVLAAKGLNIPQNLNDPNDILQYLLNTRQVSQQQVNNVMGMMNNPQIMSMFRR
jgi:hypothetical protein